MSYLSDLGLSGKEFNSGAVALIGFRRDENSSATPIAAPYMTIVARPGVYDIAAHRSYVLLNDIGGEDPISGRTSHTVDLSDGWQATWIPMGSDHAADLQGLIGYLVDSGALTIAQEREVRAEMGLEQRPYSRVERMLNRVFDALMF